MQYNIYRKTKNRYPLFLSISFLFIFLFFVERLLFKIDLLAILLLLFVVLFGFMAKIKPDSGEKQEWQEIMDNNSLFNFLTGNIKKKKEESTEVEGSVWENKNNIIAGILLLIFGIAYGLYYKDFIVPLVLIFPYGVYIIIKSLKKSRKNISLRNSSILEKNKKDPKKNSLLENIVIWFFLILGGIIIIAIFSTIEQYLPKDELLRGMVGGLIGGWILGLTIKIGLSIAKCMKRKKSHDTMV